MLVLPTDLCAASNTAFLSLCLPVSAVQSVLASFICPNLNRHFYVLNLFPGDHKCTAYLCGRTRTNQGKTCGLRQTTPWSPANPNQDCDSLTVSNRRPNWVLDSALEHLFHIQASVSTVKHMGLIIYNHYNTLSHFPSHHVPLCDHGLVFGTYGCHLSWQSRAGAEGREALLWSLYSNRINPLVSQRFSTDITVHTFTPHCLHLPHVSL